MLHDVAIACLALLLVACSSPKPPQCAPTTPTAGPGEGEGVACRRSGGRWIESDACGDDCSPQPGCDVIDMMRSACDCGADMCFDGRQCVSNACREPPAEKKRGSGPPAVMASAYAIANVCPVRSGPATVVDVPSSSAPPAPTTLGSYVLPPPCFRPLAGAEVVLARRDVPYEDFRDTVRNFCERRSGYAGSFRCKVDGVEYVSVWYSSGYGRTAIFIRTDSGQLASVQLWSDTNDLCDGTAYVAWLGTPLEACTDPAKRDLDGGCPGRWSAEGCTNFQVSDR